MKVLYFYLLKVLKKKFFKIRMKLYSIFIESQNYFIIIDLNLPILQSN